MKRKKPITKRISENEVIHYVIYARRSREEDEMQKESIPQQLEQCFNFVRNNNLLLQPRPANLPPSNKTIREIEEAYENNPDKMDFIRTQYIENSVYTEAKSAKIPNQRSEWDKIIQGVQLGEIRGTLGYAPDRFSRNLQEGGTFIQLIDQGLLDAKFTNFAFENNASGHMMLGIFFVFAEHYSKKLSEDSNRGTKQKSFEGKAVGVRKYGYDVDPKTDFFIPHPINFQIIRKAFERKIYDNWSDVAIAKEIMENPEWQGKENFQSKDISQLDLWNDSFYYGLWTRRFQKGGDIQIDFRNIPNYDFKPMISEEEFYILQEFLVDQNRKARRKFQTQSEKTLNEIKPISKGVVLNENGIALNPTLPNPKRLEKKLKNIQNKNPNATLPDVVEGHQIKFRVSKTAKNQTNTIDFSSLERFILHYFKEFKLTERKKQAYLYRAYTFLENQDKERNQEERRINLLKNKIKAEQSKFYNDTNFGVGFEGASKKEWDKKNSSFEYRLSILSNDEIEVRKKIRNEILEQQALAELLSNLPKLWKKASYVQKRKICDLLVLNIHLNDEKPHRIVLNGDFEDCFSCLVAEGGFEPPTFGL